MSRGGAPLLGENQGGRKWRLEEAAAKVRVDEEEEAVCCCEEEEGGEEEENCDDNEDGVFTIKVAITDRPIASVC